VVAAAVLRRSRLWIRHYNRKNDRETEREISPQRLVHYRGNWYVERLLPRARSAAQLAVDAIRTAELREARARKSPPPSWTSTLARATASSPAARCSGPSLRFTPEAARWWPRKAGTEAARALRPRRSYLLEVPYSHDRELLMELLKFGADVEVLEPSELRRRVETRSGWLRSVTESGCRGALRARGSLDEIVENVALHALDLQPVAGAELGPFLRPCALRRSSSRRSNFATRSRVTASS